MSSSATVVLLCTAYDHLHRTGVRKGLDPQIQGGAGCR
ncbi:hypothetical protein SLNWT_3763 [Streptomyces albus]|uniref:Uncharacterized protein n=1 Tax=Streptomyces albus (strain ATCC 21838 / DSM 41398 / FERM P-419 / JCM 4703 / NBRC 107858) TaxID=1081613 RepID=A0A0B5ER91_STRA4|nr:hypothetical protein SLNWT_3763 [Streptomyces albus]AOU78444.1 hypothetical protein SLNHY_3753 [Streptomyces albus]